MVVLALPRTDPHLFAAMLGTMRAGCAYCAVDPSFPAAANRSASADRRSYVHATRGAPAAGGTSSATWPGHRARTASKRSSAVRSPEGVMGT